MSDITVTPELLDEIEELARYAGGEAWGISETDGLMIVADDREIASTATGDLSGDGADWDDLEDKAKFIARMDPPTTLALVARIRELEHEAFINLTDYETSLETMSAVHEAKVRDLEAENADLKHDIARYIEINSEILAENEVVRAQSRKASVPESPNSSNSQGSLDGSSEHNNPIGWIFFNPDAGVEFSENHPIESGEVPDAENVREATSETLLEELLSAWKDWEADRQILDEYKSAAADPVKAQLVEALTRQGNNMSFILNHMTIPDQYYEKFTRELSEDRAALAAAEAEENRNKG